MKCSYLIFILLIAYPIFTSSALADTNLVSNPGLESGTTTPLNWTLVNQGGNIPVWDSVSHSGSRSIKISIPGTTNGISGYPQSDIITAQPLTTYTASVWGKTQNAGGSNTPAARVVELDANKTLIRQTNLPVFSRGTNDWTQKTIEFQTGADTRYLYVYANIWNGYGDFWMDDVELSLKTNIIVNPGLESGTTTPLNWTFVNQGGNTPFWDSVPHNGSRSIKISIPGTTNGISGYPQSDIITARPLTTYTASVWGKTQNAGGSNTPAARVVELDANKNWIRQANLPVFSRGTNDWTQKTIEFQTDPNTKYLYVYANIWNGYGDFWMDDVTLSFQTTPATTPPLPIPTTTTPLPVPTTIIPTPLPTSLPSYSYLISTDGNKVYAKKRITEKIDYSGTFNQVLLSTLKPGNHVYIKDGVYKLDTIELLSDVIIECESNNVIIQTSTTKSHLIYLRSNSTIKNCTFEGNGGNGRDIIYVFGNIKNWNVIGNHFYNTGDAVAVVNPETTYPPTNGFGSVLNNTGLHTQLGYIENGRNITIKGNKFYDVTGTEFFDFNGNTHYNIFENNTFINADGYYITDEAIDMIGYNTYNVVKNNYIKANFQRGIRPSRNADHNIIESNYIEYKKGKIPNEGGIVLWNSGAVPSKIPSFNTISNNTIIGTKEGIALCGAQYNTVINNKISKSIKGISITKDIYNGASAVSKNNTISKNTISYIDYGIYISSSPNNVITNNIIKNYKITDIYRR